MRAAEQDDRSTGAAGHVGALARYPVKSLLGESLPRARFGTRLEGDRCWAVYTEDGRLGSGKNSRRFRAVDGLLHLRARLAPQGPLVRLPDGRELPAGEPGTDAELSALLGAPLALRPETTQPHHDDSPVHVVTTAALRRLAGLLGEPVDPARFRANVVVDTGDAEGFVEDRWLGRELHLGAEVVLRLTEPMPRCVMVTAAQEALPRAPQVLKTLGAVHDVEFGLQAEVVRGGSVALGDPVLLG
ncbi:hypothetical protein CLV92_103270 [Kineococcus xinjiangensis]|uniref:MOSC domain-containing protein n=1 Tax=Kineococcus xinjiangensis TaxID=512762 RepID=A0A2S6IUC3_9ACTN|nr:MOSC domain-containing protein [Kineococcus xinjiangensis]PPK97735.1 hypothetical protein CLV92_103270 [Kineococcus xinjiangensis]